MCSRAASLDREEQVERCDDLSAFADRAADALRRSQPDVGSAPRNRKTWPIGAVVSPSCRRERHLTRSSPRSALPSSATISVSVMTSTLEVAAMRWTRYCDMLLASSGLRTIILTFAAWPARKTAACPAELPPPTTMTSCRAHSFASNGDAQYHTPRPSNAERFSIAGRR